MCSRNMFASLTGMRCAKGGSWPPRGLYCLLAPPSQPARNSASGTKGEGEGELRQGKATLGPNSCSEGDDINTPGRPSGNTALTNPHRHSLRPPSLTNISAPLPFPTTFEALLHQATQAPPSTRRSVTTTSRRGLATTLRIPRGALAEQRQI